MFLKRIILTFILVLIASLNVVAQINTERRNITNNFDRGYWVYVVDFDGDGDADIVASSLSSGVGWFKNDGAGNFTYFPIDAGFLDAWSVHANDFDGDGDLDVVSCSESRNEVAWYRRSGDNNFDKRTIDDKSLSPHAVYSGDFNGDGYFDITAVEWEGDIAVIYDNDGTGNFVKRTLDSNFRSGHALHADDIDQDGDTDIIAGSSGKIMLYRNDGTGKFSNVPVSGNVGAFGVFAADVDQDGLLDIIAGERPDNQQDISWYKNQGGTFAKQKPVSANYGEAWSVQAADLDLDGDVDILAAGFVPNKVSYWLNNGNQSFTEFDLDVRVTRPRGISLGDFDQDGDRDFLSITRDDDALYWYRIEGSPPPQKSITLTSPNGGETLNGGSLFPVTWTSVGDFTNVRIEYSTDGGGTWIEVVASTPNTGTYSWLVPSSTVPSALLRLSDALDLTTQDVSDAPFAIVHTATDFTIIAPNGGESWGGGSLQFITWTGDASIANVSIEYSLDNGTSWNLLEPSTPNDGSYDWRTPDVQTDQALVRIADAVDGEPADTSDATFAIVAAGLTLLQPNGGESLEAGGTATIIWTTVGNLPTIDIEYSTNNGTTWLLVAEAVQNTGQYQWNVPTQESTTALVRISDAGDGMPSDQSDAPFAITGASITVTSPNGGENWFGGSTQQITWTTTGGIDFIRIEYSPDNGATWQIVVPLYSNSGSYNWTVPTATTTSGLIKISHYDDFPSDVSDAPFTVSGTGLRVVTPNGGEVLHVGTTQPIAWQTNGQIDSVKLSMTYAGQDSLWITGPILNTGAYSWTVPDIPSTDASICVWDITNDNIYDCSDSTFTILKTGVTVLYPNGGEVLQGGTVRTITWQTDGTVNAVNIDYSPDNGSSWISIASETPNTGSYDWTLPSITSLQALIRVSNSEASNSFDISDATFNIIVSSLTVTSPNGGEQWEPGSVQNITWYSTGVINSINIDYSLDNGTTWNVVVASRSNSSGTFSWTLPNVESDSVMVRVSADGGMPFDVSDATFKIRAVAASVNSSSGIVPTTHALLQNYPNPFNMDTRIGFLVPAVADVKLEIYDVRGKRIRTLVSQRLQAGEYFVPWNGLDLHGLPLTSGVYIYRIQIGKWQQAKRLLLLK